MQLLVHVFWLCKRVVRGGLLVLVWLVTAVYFLKGATCLWSCPIDENKARELAISQFHKTAKETPPYDPAMFEGPHLTSISSPFGTGSCDCAGYDWGVTLLVFLFDTSSPLLCGAAASPDMYVFDWEYRGKRAMSVWVDRCGEDVKSVIPSQ